MATYGSTLRRGLPRTPGGEPWPAAGSAPADAVPAASAAPAAAVPAPSAPATETPSVAAEVAPAPEPAATQPAPAPDAVQPTPPAEAAPVALRRGLPRTPGGEAWPPAGTAPAGAAPVASIAAPAAQSAPVSAAETVSDPAPAQAQEGTAVALRRGLPRTPGGDAWPAADVARPSTPSAQPAAAPDPAAAGSDAPAAASVVTEDGPELRRGLPRTPGGEPWPPAGALAKRTVVVAPAAASVDEVAAAAPRAVVPADAAASAPAVPTGPVAPLSFPRTVTPGKYAFIRPEPAPEPERIGPFTKKQWAGAAVIAGIGLLGAAAMAVFFVRWLLSVDFMQDFLTAYPGEYHLPESAPVGFPGWLGWQHFFNFFLMVLIIRSGLRVRTEARPAAYWTPRRNPGGKVSLTIWFHQSLDLLWVINGVVFLVLLFVTGQWMRVVPTSWEVFPNALSAVLQYVSLDWPTENGWVNYNSVQQLAYFTTIFVAAPLAVITGVRMSGIWPKNAKTLNRIYPVEWARALHFPVMLYFVVFIAVHVFLVFATGALRNLNHMYAAQGSIDPTAYADNWTGFWMFAASLVVIAAAWVAARPLVLAPIARLFGTVSSR